MKSVMTLMTSNRIDNNDNVTLRYVNQFLAILITLILCQHTVDRFHLPYTYYNLVRLRDVSPPMIKTTTDGANCYKSAKEGAVSKFKNNNSVSARSDYRNVVLNYEFQRHYAGDHKLRSRHLYLLSPTCFSKSPLNLKSKNPLARISKKRFLHSSGSPSSLRGLQGTTSTIPTGEPFRLSLTLKSNKKYCAQSSHCRHFTEDRTTRRHLFYPLDPTNFLKLSPNSLHAAKSSSSACGQQGAISPKLTGDSPNIILALVLATIYCAVPTHFRVIMDADPIANVQTFFTLRDYQAPMLVTTTNDANDPVEPVFGLDNYFKWNDNQSIPKYSRVVGKAIVVKILKPEPFEPSWFKDDVLEVIDTAVKEDLTEKKEIMADLSILSEGREKLAKKIDILSTTCEAIKRQINTDKVLETHRFVTLPGRRVSFNALTKSFHWKFVNCFNHSTHMSALDCRVVEESISRHVLQKVRENNSWLRNVITQGGGFFVDGSGTKRKIVLKITRNPGERVRMHDMINALNHYEPVDMDAVRSGPTTRQSQLSRGYEHQSLPDNFEDDESDPDPEDRNACTRIDADSVLACVNRTCPQGCEECRSLTLMARYYYDNNVNDTPRAQRRRARHRLDVRTSSSSSPGSDMEPGERPRAQINHEVAYNLTESNQPTRPQTARVLCGYAIPDLNSPAPRADDIPPGTLAEYRDPRLIPGAVQEAFEFKNLPPISEAGPPSSERNCKIIGYLNHPMSEDPARYGDPEDGVEMNDFERRQLGLRRGHREVKVGAIYLGVLLDFLRMRSDMLYANTMDDVYRPKEVIVKCLNKGWTNQVTKRYPHWFNRVRTRAFERRCSYKSAQLEIFLFCHDLEHTSEEDNNTDESSNSKKENSCPMCELSDNGGNELRDNHTCKLKKDRRDFSKDNKLVVQPPRERPYDSSGEENISIRPMLKANSKKRRLNTEAKSGVADYDADNEDEHTNTATASKEGQPKKRTSLRKNDAPAVFFGKAYIHRNVDELMQQWREKVDEADSLEEESLVISWNNSTMIWNHKDKLDEVVYIFVRPSGEWINVEDIDHAIKNQSQEHVDRVSRGDPDLQELIRKYFAIVRDQLIKRLNKIKADTRAQTDARKQRGDHSEHFDRWHRRKHQNQEPQG